MQEHIPPVQSQGNSEHRVLHLFPERKELPQTGNADEWEQHSQGQKTSQEIAINRSQRAKKRLDDERNDAASDQQTLKELEQSIEKTGSSVEQQVAEWNTRLKALAKDLCETGRITNLFNHTRDDYGNLPEAVKKSNGLHLPMEYQQVGGNTVRLFHVQGVLAAEIVKQKQ